MRMVGSGPEFTARDRRACTLSCALKERLEGGGDGRAGQVAGGAVEVEQPDAFR